jgi:NhaA family Na+:H+ antiporter
MMSEKATAQSRLAAFIHHETTAGLALVLAAVAALVLTNAGGRDIYEQALATPFTLAYGSFGLSKSLHHWINDGLMAVFFFLVGLEIKREVMEGNLSSRDQIVLPGLAALGGMAAPALIYLLATKGSPELAGGWAIPAATDIAFALGALSLAGRRAPASLKVFLLTLATLDDLGAIVIIALFYTSGLSLLSLVLAAMALVVLAALNRFGVERVGLYVLAGLALWVFVLKSGVHATLAGVALAFTIPLKSADGTPIIAALEEKLHNYVKFLILPLFAFANAGLPLEGLSLASLAAPLPLGIAAGLVVGKPLGILLVVGLAVLARLARLPEGCRFWHMAGVASLAGIGFTMSLFIGSLAFEEAAMANAVRAGVMAGSLVSTVLGLSLLLLAPRST